MPFNTRDLTNSPLFKMFWQSNEAGMSRRGLDEVTADGVEKLAEYARTHDAEGNPSTGDAQQITDDERAVIKAILEHDHYGTFFEQDALPVLYEKFGIDPGAIHGHAGGVKPPVDAGKIELPAKVSRMPPSQLARVPVDRLDEVFNYEYEQRRDYFEGNDVPKAERGKRVLGLLRDYTEYMWSHGEQKRTEQGGTKLLAAFFAKPHAAQYGSTDYNGFGVGAAQSLVLGQDINAFKKKFPKAYPSAESTYLAMNDNMAAPMAHVDKYLAAKGLATGAEKFERAPYLGYLIGDESGHTKHGSLSESAPFSSSGVNWGKVLFTGDKEIAELPAKDGFEFPIDCVDAYGRAIGCLANRGDRLEVRDKDGKAVKVEKVIHKDADDKATSWSAKFIDAAGKELAASDVTGVILDRAGQIKGDGKTNGSVNMWWYGFCDRNTAQRLYKSRFQIPELDRETIRIKAGSEIVEVPRADAQKLIDADVPDLVTGESMCGFRFNDEPQIITLKSGERFQGRVHANIMTYGPGTSRIGEDNISVHDAPGRPLLGTVGIKGEGGDVKRVDCGQIDSFTQDPATGKVTIQMKEGNHPDSYVGELTQAIDWSKATDKDGKKVLKQATALPVRGELSVAMPDGSEKLVPAGEIREIIGEMQDDLRISQYLTWVSQQEGMFATDNSKGVVVSNGMRWVNKIELDARTGDERPEWASAGELTGIQGKIERQEGDKIVWARARYGTDADADIRSTQFAGWMQVSANGTILNEGFVNGAPDFGWGASGNLDWKARSSFNAFVDPEMRLQLLINGVTDDAKLQALADAGNLPGNWRKYRVAQEAAPSATPA